MKLIQVFSPHFDDGVLSCGQHILEWQKQGFEVEVITVFTEFETKHLSGDSLEFMHNSGVASLSGFQKVRAAEDRRSLAKLGVKQIRWLGLTDGGFRDEQVQPVYRTHALLFAGQILDSASWQAKLTKEVQKALHKDAYVVAPLGVGQHADHLLIHKTLKTLVSKERLGFYVDIPYAFQLSNWRPKQLLKLVSTPRSIYWSSKTKLAALNEYQSQTPLLFQTGMWQYPECLLGKL